MLQIKRFVCNVIQENCYVVSDETQEAVIIDCGAQFEAERQAIKNYIESNHLRPVHLLATHGHVDHNIGNKWVHIFRTKMQPGEVISLDFTMTLYNE